MARKKPHASDVMLARQIGTCKEFTAFLFRGPHDRVTERGFATYRAAREAGDKLQADNPECSRKVIIYGITPGNFSIPCEPDLMMIYCQTRIDEIDDLPEGECHPDTLDEREDLVALMREIENGQE